MYVCMMTVRVSSLNTFMDTYMYVCTYVCVYVTPCVCRVRMGVWVPLAVLERRERR